MLDITVQLNTNITNQISDARVVTAAEGGVDAPIGYQDGGIRLVAKDLTSPNFMIGPPFVVTEENFGDGELSDDGDAIEWTEIDTTMINLATGEMVFNLVISGIRSQRLHGGRWRRYHGDCHGRRHDGPQCSAESRGRDRGLGRQGGRSSGASSVQTQTMQWPSSRSRKVLWTRSCRLWTLRIATAGGDFHRNS